MKELSMLTALTVLLWQTWGQILPRLEGDVYSPVHQPQGLKKERERDLGSKGSTTHTPFSKPPLKAKIIPPCLNKEFLSCIKTKASVQKQQLESRNPCTLECHIALKTSLWLSQKCVPFLHRKRQSEEHPSLLKGQDESGEMPNFKAFLFRPPPFFSGLLMNPLVEGARLMKAVNLQTEKDPNLICKSDYWGKQVFNGFAKWSACLRCFASSFMRRIIEQNMVAYWQERLFATTACTFPSLTQTNNICIWQMKNDCLGKMTRNPSAEYKQNS